MIKSLYSKDEANASVKIENNLKFLFENEDINPYNIARIKHKLGINTTLFEILGQESIEENEIFGLLLYEMKSINSISSLDLNGKIHDGPF